ncbi:hypothetical protein ASE08_00235 [Rhizobacter sp. Root16D2]|nr:hypothetical protein ASC88_06280 [Rhizobacter sp. Root29]KQW10596.1 hypothetical protein ASC98_22355 [Rhizobacter sp. Root1238]KRB24672.1 hypothetical protein ASE08_00235 [Rhizobacter sp. Root16D2]
MRRPLRPLRALSLAAVAAAASFGCAYPRTIHVYDEACQITARQMVLDVADVNVISSCSGNHCVVQLVGQAALLAASTVISGSIVVTGNVVYWLEKKRDCRPKPAPSDTAAPA